MFKKRLLSKECVSLLKNKGYKIVKLKDILNQVEFENTELKKLIISSYGSETFGYKNLNELNKIKLKVLELSKVSESIDPYRDPMYYFQGSGFCTDELNTNNLVRSLLEEIIRENI